MCLAIPGKLIEIEDGDDPLMKQGRVSFGGVVKQVNLAYVPEAAIGDYVNVHVGFAMSIVDADEAQKVFDYLKEIDALEDLVDPSAPSDPPSSTDTSKGGASS